MREFNFNTVGTILSKLKDSGCAISRMTFYRLEDRLGFPKAKTSGKNPWRIYSDAEVEHIVQAILQEFKKI